MRSRGIAKELNEESETIYSVLIIINKAGRWETYIYIDIYKCLSTGYASTEAILERNIW